MKIYIVTTARGLFLKAFASKDAAQEYLKQRVCVNYYDNLLIEEAEVYEHNTTET